MPAGHVHVYLGCSRSIGLILFIYVYLIIVPLRDIKVNDLQDPGILCAQWMGIKASETGSTTHRQQTTALSMRWVLVCFASAWLHVATSLYQENSVSDKPESCELYFLFASSYNHSIAVASLIYRSCIGYGATSGGTTPFCDQTPTHQRQLVKECIGCLHVAWTLGRIGPRHPLAVNGDSV